GILHSFMESHIDGVVLLATDFVQKDEKKDERMDRILDMINRKHDWNNHESGEEKGEDQAADTERGENSHVAENVDGASDISGRNKRKHADRGAESRKKNVLCHLAASSKGNIDTDMKNFLEGLVQASFTTFGEKLCQQFSDRTTSERTEQFETVVTDRLGKIEAEVTQLRTTLVVTELVGKSDQASGPSMTKINSGPSTSKKGTVPSKKKAVKNQELKTADSCVNLPRANVTQSSASDLRRGTQEFLESCMKNLPLDTFVKGLNLSQAKVEDSWDWLELPKSLKNPTYSLELPKSLKKPAVQLDDRDIELDGEDFPDRCLVFVHPADFKKMHECITIHIGPSMLNGDLAGRIMSASKNGIKPNFINPISLDLTPIWTILEPNPDDFSEIADAVMLVVELHRMVKKGAPKKTKEAAPAATQTRDTTAASTSAQPESDEPREAAPWPRDPLTPFSKLPTIHNRHISSKKELKELASYAHRDYYAG
ncbi:hypothetical protein IGI04_014565, partial [Brassica rapa subsp. trilocularis]